jgi:hypothetical protein
MMPNSRRRLKAESLMVVEISKPAEKSIKTAIPIEARDAAFNMLNIWSR